MAVTVIAVMGEVGDREPKGCMLILEACELVMGTLKTSTLDL
jgi:hypothetical protein